MSNKAWKRVNGWWAIKRLALWRDGIEPESCPVWVGGTGAPTASYPKGSVWQRVDGSGAGTVLYVATDSVGTWAALSNTAVAAQVATAGGETYVVNLEASATGEALIKLADNKAVACAFRESTNAYLTFVTTNSSESVAVGQRLTTTDGVASGTARKVGGVAAAVVAASTAVTGTTETRTVFDQSYTMPANTLKAGTVVKIRAAVFHTATTGAETHTLAVAFDATDLAVTGNLDPADNGVTIIDFTITCRTAGATGTIVGCGTAVNTARAAAVTATHGLFTGSTSTSTQEIDTTAAIVIGIAIDRQGTATDSDSCRLDYLTVEIIG